MKCTGAVFLHTDFTCYLGRDEVHFHYHEDSGYVSIKARIQHEVPTCFFFGIWLLEGNFWKIRHGFSCFWPHLGMCLGYYVLFSGVAILWGNLLHITFIISYWYMVI